MRVSFRPADRPDDWRVCLPEPARRAVRAWLWSIAAMTFAVLVLGGITRLTQSGLSIVDWDPLIGVVPPLTEAQWEDAFERYQAFPEYQQLRRGMTVGEFQVIYLWEYFHRLAARLIGAVFLVPFVWFWTTGSLPRPLARRALALFALGALQGVMGWLMVRSGLVDRPSVSHYRLAAHLLLAFVIFGWAVWLARDLAGDCARTGARAKPGRAVSRGLAVMGGLLVLQIVWGAFTAGLHAGWVFNTFPRMAGELVPLHLLDRAAAAVQEPGAVQLVHRLLGTAVLGAALWLLLLARAAPPPADPLSRRLGAALFLLVAAQYLLGVLTLVFRVPVGLAAAHQATAMVVAGVWVVWAHRAWRGTAGAATRPRAAAVGPWRPGRPI